MILIAVIIGLLVAALLWIAARTPAVLVDRHAEELALHKAEIEKLARANHDGMITDVDVKQQTIDLQRRMLRSRRDKSHTARLADPKEFGILMGVIMLLGSGVYLYYGNPAFADHPAPAIQKSPQAQSEYTAARDQLIKQPDDVNAWLAMSAALVEMGETQRAAEALQKATEVMPGQVDLWVARGQALVAHAGGIVTPAARLAFDHASTLDPKHPGPRLYLALAWMQAAQPEEALKVLEPLAKDSPPNAPWMPKVSRMITGCKTMLAAGVGKN